MRNFRLSGPLAHDVNAGILHSLLVGLLAWTSIYLLFLLPRFAVGAQVEVALLFSEIVAFAAALIVLRRGLFRSASALYLIGIGVPTTILIALHDGIFSPVLVLYVSIAVSAVWLLGYHAAVTACVACLTVSLAMAVLETFGIRIPQYITGRVPLAMWALLVQAILIAAVPVMALLRTLKNALDSANRSIRELNAADGTLRGERDLLTHIVETTPGGIIVTNGAGQITFANSSAERIFGLNRDAITNRVYDDARWQATNYDGAPLQDEEHPFRQVQSSGRPVRDVRILITGAEGRRVFVSVNAAPVVNEAGHFDGMVATLEDITQRARTEKELRKYREHLEELAEVRTRELEVARDQAMAANQAKSAFLASMSHEFRTPLNAILGFSRIMLDAAEVPAVHRAKVRIIERSGEHLLDLINDVVDMARCESGQITVENVPTDLNALVLEVTQMMAVRAENKHLRLSVDGSSALPALVHTDAGKLRQVLINLTANAITYTERGQVTVRLSAETGSRLRLRIEVSDTGVGIAPEDQERIFEPFVRADQHHTGGTGLGLTITRQYVRQMGGTISVDSAVGRGSTFTVVLPIQAAENAIVPARSRPRKVIGLAAGQPRYRILIVEDQQENWMLLRTLLLEAGFDVKVAENGAAGVDAFQSWQPHFIWMDWHMPVMDGREAARCIRSMSGGQSVKIAAVTASVLTEDRAGFLASGFDDLIEKPIRSAAVFECMARHLDVRYVYEQGTHMETVATSAAAALNADALRVLPEALRGELANALVRLDVAEIGTIIRRASEVDSDLGAVLAWHANRLAFTSLLKAVEGGQP